MDLSFAEALREWWAGTLAHDAEMMGLEIFWWERIGKLLGFVGGLSVVLDIVGPQKVRTAGRRLRDWLTVTDAMKGVVYSWLFFSERMRFKRWSVSRMCQAPSRRWFGRLPAEWKPKVRQFLDDALKEDAIERQLDEVETESHGLGFLLAMIVSVIAIGMAMGIAAERWDGMYFLMFFMVLCVAYLFLVVPLLTRLLDAFTPLGMSVALVLSSLLALVVDAVIDMVADVLESRENDAWLRTVGMAFFVLGFGLDLLGG